MISLEQARQLALEYIQPSAESIRKTTPEDDLVIERIVEFEDCWLFHINSRLYLETHEVRYRPLEGGPVIVGKEDGDVYQGGPGGTEQEWVGEFREAVRNRPEKPSKAIFISYSRRDQEFVTRLASDLNQQVAGVWFDQSAIQLGEKWHDEIMEGIRECKAFVLVLSPDSMESRYVREEVNKALELGKTIFPVIYRPAKWTGQFETLIREVQTLDLRSGSYTDNFQKLVDGLIEAGAGKPKEEQPFLRQPTKTSLSVVFSRIPGWALAWSLGWIVFWVIVIIFLAMAVASQGKLGSEDFLNFVLILIAAGLGGFSGGLLAGLLTMLALRPNAPSISWKHMSPTIRIWGISGPLGMLLSGAITASLVAVGTIRVQSQELNCEGISQCIGAAFGSAIGEAVGLVILILAVFFFFVIAAWFLTGMFAGGLAVRHIRRLEPGITSRQGWGVSAGWGCGAILAALVMIVLIAVISNLLGL